MIIRTPTPPGVCLWFTGPSGAGKSTATGRLVALLEARGRTVTVLDVVPELSKHWIERTSEGKLMRKAFVAREVVRHGGIVVCVTATGRAEARARARAIVGHDASVEVFFDAPSDVREGRRAARSKKKPLLKRIRRGIRRMRWLGRPRPAFQRPESPDLAVTSVESTPDEIAARVLALLVERGVVAPAPDDGDRPAAGTGSGRLEPAQPS